MKSVKEIIYMNRDEVRSAIQEFPVAILPLGSTEQHGHHMPLGVDIFLAEGLARRVCTEIDALLLPTVPFGYSWVWRDIPGTVSLHEKHIESLIKDVAHSLERYGIKLLVLINGHDANAAAMKYATRDLADEGKLTVVYLSYPDLEHVIGEICISPTWHGMIHACEFETSLMLALKPELVDMQKAEKEYPLKPDLYGKSAISLSDLSESGVFGDPTLATKEKGEKILDYYVQSMGQTILEAYSQLTYAEKN